MKIASRLVDIKPSITLAVTARAARLRASGVDVIGFGAGEPDADTPEHIKDAAKRALDAGMTKYTEIAGTVALRKAIVKEMQKAHGLEFSPDQELVSCGAKHSLYNLFQALLPAPYWVSYPDMVKLAGGKPVVIHGRAEHNFCVTADDVRRALSPRTRAFVLNSPSNPTGGAYDLERLHASSPTTSTASWSTAASPSTRSRRCRGPWPSGPSWWMASRRPTR
jgi:aspartate aminotransferase